MDSITYKKYDKNELIENRPIIIIKPDETKSIESTSETIIDNNDKNDDNDNDNENDISSDEDYFLDNNDAYSFFNEPSTSFQQQQPKNNVTILLSSTVTEPINCDVCKKKFYNLTLYYEHKMKSIDCVGKSFACGFCNETIIQNDDDNDENTIHKHIREHLVKQRFYCQHCKRYEKGSIIEQDNHIFEKFGVKHLICLECRQTFPTLFEQSIHECENDLKIEFTNSSKRNIHRTMCELCGKLTASMLNHMKIHNDIRPYQCNLCDSKFRTKFQILRHQQAHKRRAIVCNMCERKFYWFETFSIHMKKCHPIDEKCKKPLSYKCRYCKSKYSYEQELQAHELIHRPYECKHCNESFQDLNQLEEHHYMEHSELPYEQQPEYYTVKCDNNGKPILKKNVIKPVVASNNIKTHVEIPPEQRLENPSNDNAMDIENDKGDSFSSKNTEIVDNAKKIIIKKVPFACVKCKMIFKSNLLLIEHRMKIHNVKYKCKVCEFETKNMKHMYEHRH